MSDTKPKYTPPSKLIFWSSVVLFAAAVVSKFYLNEVLEQDWLDLVFFFFAWLLLVLGVKIKGL